MKTVVFDLDGTLADTSADLLAAANACFEQLGHGVVLDGRDVLTAFHGGRAMLRAGFDRLGVEYCEDDIAREYPRLLRAYEGGIDTHTRMYPGAVAAVEALRAAGMAVSICTNKPEYLAEELLRRLGVRDLFGALVGADTLRCASLIQHLISRRCGGSVAWWRGQCWWAIPRRIARPGWLPGCRWPW